MGDRRRYTGSQTLQVGWTILVAVLGAVAVTVASGEVQFVAVGALSLVWLVGLVAVALYDRRHWNNLVDASSFEREQSTREVDLQKIQDGRAVRVTTNMPGLLSQTHTEVSTRVEDVDASFTVHFRRTDSADASEGLQTGTEALDDRFVIEGTEGNVAKILSTDVQRELLAVETPGTCTVTGTTVTYDVPFTRMSATELEAIASLVVTIALRVEEIARQ